MKTIKFRIWNGKDKFCTNSFVKSNLYNILDTRPEYVQQFTGLLDKQGKEIYEGDIVKATLWGMTIVNFLATIEFKYGCFGIVCQDSNLASVRGDNKGKWKSFYQKDDWSDIEIIGNIYENPELLK